MRVGKGWQCCDCEGVFILTDPDAAPSVCPYCQNMKSSKAEKILRAQLSGDKWLTIEEAVQQVMVMMQCSRAEALDLLEQFRVDQPDSYIGVALDS